MTRPHPRTGRARPGGDRNGVALPVALFALIAVSVLITGLLVGTTTDAALSLTQRDAVEDLYAAEAAVHAWAGLHRDTPLLEGTASWTPPGDSVPVRIQVERLAAMLPGDDSAGVNGLYSIHASRSWPGGARGVVTLFRAREAQLPALDLRLGAALLLGGGGRLVGGYTGEVLVHDAGGGPFCAGAGNLADDPVLHAAGSSLQLLAGAAVDGTPRQSPLDASALLAAALPGLTIRDLAWNAETRLGRFFNEPAFEPGSLPRSGHADPRYDWGCPAALVELVRAAAPGPHAPGPCPAGADTSRYASIAIDAGNDELVLSGDHGQGVLIVVNGTLHLTGSFVFQGLVLAERDVVLSGAGWGWPPSVEGAVIAGGSALIDRARTPPGLGGGGTRAVRFNRCAFERGVAALNGTPGADPGAPRALGRPHAWAEVPQ